MDIDGDQLRDRIDRLRDRWSNWLDQPTFGWDVPKNRRPQVTPAGTERQAYDSDFWRWLARHPDPYGAMLEIRRAHVYRPYVGIDGDTGDLVLADEDSAVLALGPSGGGKTSGLMVQNILTAPGPVVSTASRADSALATVGARSRVGTCWHFSPTDPAPFGLKTLRYSPLTGCQDYSVAAKAGQRWTTYDSLGAAARENDGGQNPYFRRAAAELLAVLFFSQLQRNATWPSYLTS